MDHHSLLTTAQSWRRSRYSARPFALTLLAIILITILALAQGSRVDHGRISASGAMRKRDLLIMDEECRLVHNAADQCAFVLGNCPDEEAGIFSYLTLYYCRLPHAKPVAFVIMTLWLGLLFSTIGIAASDFFCINLNTIANMLGMSESLAGVTLLAFGNGSPDVFSTFAAFRTHAASLALGELIGAACFITAVVSGSMALIRPFGVARKSFIRDVAFFLVAASFAMGFIVDGKLHLWESATMVGFYLFYVAFVVAWHWWFNLRRARRQKAAAIRNQYITPGGDEEEVPEYHDEETTSGTRTPGRGVSIDDFSTLERAGRDYISEDDNEEERERWMGELTNNMRVNRPNSGSRRNTHNPIRPSLVGALEFRAVLSSLQKSRNIQSMPINLRRYSDDPNYTTAQQQDYISTSADPSSRPHFDVASVTSNVSPHVIRPNPEIQHHMGNRARAVSTNDVDNVRLQSSTLRGAVPDIAFLSGTPNSHYSLLSPGHETLSPTIISPVLPREGSRSRIANQALPRAKQPSPNSLAPPNTENLRASPIHLNSATPSPLSSPILEAGERPAPPSLKLTVPEVGSPLTPFPVYTENTWSAQTSLRPTSLRPRSPSASPESVHVRDSFVLPDLPKTPRWWPSRLLPSPYVLLSTLFPTLTKWSDKNIFEKIMGVVASIPVFLLTITLPVVELQRDESEVESTDLSVDFGLPPPLTPLNGNAPLALPAESSRNLNLPRANRAIPGPEQRSSSESLSAAAIQTPQVYITTEDDIAHSPEQLAPPTAISGPKEWNRWLVFVQIFTAPLFLVLILWANLEPDNTRTLLRHILYSLVASLCVLAFLLITTTPSRPPRWRPMLCFLGFAVSIAWISTVANEVVGVLRTLGVILNMSDAILGLTIFAVGNSLGDLVADITVARLGFPIMALSACFGGPMLNILLGVGLSGLYMTITKGEHRHEKHPDRPIHFKPYHITINTTLVISGATLLVTLAGLLVMVPMRKWRMDGVVGWMLISLWSVSTFANVLVEVLGFASDVS